MGGKLDGEGDPDPKGVTGRLLVNFKSRFGALLLAHHGCPQPRISNEFPCLFFHPNKPRIKWFLSKSLGFN